MIMLMITMTMTTVTTTTTMMMMMMMVVVVVVVVAVVVVVRWNYHAVSLTFVWFITIIFEYHKWFYYADNDYSNEKNDCW